MKRELLLGLGLLLSIGAAKAQFLPYNKTTSPVMSSTPYNWVSDGNTNNYVESGVAESPLTAQTDGALRLISAVNGAKINLLSSNKFFIGGTLSSLSKFAHYGLTKSSPVAKISFKMTVNLNPDAASKSASAISLTIGKHVTGLMRNGSSVYRSNAEIFSSLRWLYVSNKFDFQYREGSTANTTSNLSLSNTLITPGTEYQYDFYYNNSDATVSYVHNENNYSIASGKIDVFVNNTKLATVNRTIEKSGNGALTDNLTSVALAQGSSLDSYMFIQSGGANTTASDGFTISDLSITYKTETNLPVSLTSFTGKLNNNFADLKWSTSSESNNSHFEVLRSLDSKNFNVIGSVAGNGTTSNAKEYNYTDKSPLAGTNYYQLKQYDLDGKETTIEKVVAINTILGNAEFKVYINEANQLTANIYSENKSEGKISIHDISGKQVFQENISLEKGNNSFVKSLPFLQNGVYVLKLAANGNTKSIKFIK